jgi:hypothetical protein
MTLAYRLTALAAALAAYAPHTARTRLALIVAGLALAEVRLVNTD